MNGLLRYATGDEKAYREQKSKYDTARKWYYNYSQSPRYQKILENEWEESRKMRQKAGSLPTTASMFDFMSLDDYKQWIIKSPIENVSYRGPLQNDDGTYENNSFYVPQNNTIKGVDDVTLNWPSEKNPLYTKKISGVFDHEVAHVRGSPKDLNLGKDSSAYQYAQENWGNYLPREKRANAPTLIDSAIEKLKYDNRYGYITKLTPYAFETLKNAGENIPGNKKYQDWLSQYSKGNKEDSSALDESWMYTYKDPEEMYATLTKLKKDMEQIGYNPSTDDFNENWYKKANEKGMLKDTIFDFMDYETLTKLMNTIAANKQSNSYSNGVV